MNSLHKVVIFFAAVIVLAVLPSCTRVPDGAVPAREIVSFCVGDVTDDSAPEFLAISGSGKIETGEHHGQLLLVCDESAGDDLHSLGYIPADKIRHSIDLTGIMPMKVQIGDIDGDGINEVAICVYKTAKFHEVMAKRPFFFDLVEGNLIPVWLGSRLSRPFDDYILYDINADDYDEIISIELLENGSRVVTAYIWKGFGFEIIAESEGFNGQLRFDAEVTSQSGICVIFSSNKEKHELIFSLKDDSLVYEKINS